MKVQSPFFVRLAGRVFATGLSLLFLTLRRSVQTTEHANPYSSHGDRRFLYCVWHDSAAIAAFGGKHVHTVALTSRHRDGLFVTTVTRHVGVTAVRGSTGATGGRVLRQMLRVAHEKDIVITPDGPRGPSRQMSRGIVFLASPPETPSSPPRSPARAVGGSPEVGPAWSYRNRSPTSCFWPASRSMCRLAWICRTLINTCRRSRTRWTNWTKRRPRWYWRQPVANVESQSRTPADRRRAEP